MSSRLQKIGTIFSRVQGLIKKGVIKEDDRPVWFDVYARFPPKFEPTFAREAAEKNIIEIFYPEDVLRAELHKKYLSKSGVVNLESKDITNSQKWIKMYLNHVELGFSEREALDKVLEHLKLETTQSE